jgi:hypothetical protein
MALVALAIVFGCAGVGFGQDDNNPPIVGGYSKVATNNPAVAAAADFAVSEQKRRQNGPLSLTEIKRAERQSVAGTNYRLCLNVKAGDEDDAGVEAWDVEAVVFEKLPRAPGNKYKLTSWVKKDCGGSDSEENHATAFGKYLRPNRVSGALKTTSAPDVPEITGTVTSSGSGKKLAGVTIGFYDKGSRFSSATSRGDGTYFIRDEAFLGRDSFVVRVTQNGYAEWTKAVDLDAQQLTVNIELTPN